MAAGGAAGLPAAHSGERPRGPGRAGRAGGVQPAEGVRPGGLGWLLAAGRATPEQVPACLPESRGTGASNPGSWTPCEASLPAVGPAIWDWLEPVAPGKGPRDGTYVPASFHLGACCSQPFRSLQHLVLSVSHVVSGCLS